MAVEKESKVGKTLFGIAKLIRLLPTGTVFLFQFLSPLLTNSGNCNTINKYLTGILLTVCGFSCSFACFTDSYKGSDGKTYYGVATKHGLCVLQKPSLVDPIRHGLLHDSEASSVDLSSYKLRLGDFAHSFFAVIVFGAVALLDRNTVNCYYPSAESNKKVLLMALPPVIGAMSTAISIVFPYKRHGIGYPSTTV